MTTEHALWLANRPVTTGRWIDVADKFSGAAVARVARAVEADVDRAIGAAVSAADAMRRLPAHKRIAVLERISAGLRERADVFAAALAAEGGKTEREARAEVARAVDTFRFAAYEVSRIGGELIPLDLTARAEGYMGLQGLFPVGPCAFVTPFNFPLNLVAHKVAPAIAAGCPFVLKPASLTPVSAVLLGELLAAAELPAGAFSILPCARDAADLLTTDDRLRLLSFTGSADVGWALKARAGRKKVVLELGGNAACIVEPDADLDDVVPRLVTGAFYQAGQSCISVQRILAHRDLVDELRERLVAATKALRAGDPCDPTSFTGPMIAESEAKRLSGWIDEAVARGATVLCGGGRQGPVHELTLVERVPEDAKLWAEEAFGPVACLASYASFDAALATVNRSRYGLQAAVFTRDLGKAQRAWRELEVGGVIVNDVPSWRADNMPYGGVKDSGLGREGVRYAIDEMMERRLLVIRPES